MLRLAVVNLNKRLNTERYRRRLLRWIHHEHIQVLVALEPWRKPGPHVAHLGDLHSVGGNGKVHVWVDHHFEPIQVRVEADFWVRVQLGYIVLHGLYLDAYSQHARANQLKAVTTGLARESRGPLIVTGDFNIAPTPTEGLLDGEPSRFNSEVDRAPLATLRRSRSLIDLGGQSGVPEWTIERRIRGKISQFRCDLALSSDYIAQDVRFRIDHGVRSGLEGFTDHSALLLDLPVTLEVAQVQAELFAKSTSGVGNPPVRRVASEKTAMHRSEPSSIASRVVRRIVEEKGISSVLDFGCGYGNDVDFYRSLGLSADGYDPHTGFGWTSRPARSYEIVTLTFVLNVIPDPRARIQVLEDAATYLKEGGRLVVATRSPEEIRRQATAGAWVEFNDGYWSHEGKRTFQRGISRKEILQLAREIGLREAESYPVTEHQAVRCVVLEHDPGPHPSS